MRRMATDRPATDALVVRVIILVLVPSGRASRERLGAPLRRCGQLTCPLDGRLGVGSRSGWISGPGTSGERLGLDHGHRTGDEGNHDRGCPIGQPGTTSASRLVLAVT